MCQNYVEYRRYDGFNTKRTMLPMVVKIMIVKMVTAIVTIRCEKGGAHPLAMLRTSFLSRILYQTAPCEPILNFNKQLWNSELYC